MTKVCYPAIFHPEEVGYTVWIPDLEKVGVGCTTFGDTLQETCEMATEALELCIETMLDDGMELPEASKPEDIQLEEKDFVGPVVADMQQYYRKHNNKSVKKTLTIPSWLNELAEEKNIGMSRLLQKALAAELGVEL